MAKNHDSSTFLFPSNSPTSYPSESTAPSSSSPPSPQVCSSQSTSSLNSPYKSSSSPPRKRLSRSSSTHLPPAALGPCAACKFQNRRWSENCYLASFLPPNEVHKLSVVESVFGSGNVDNFLQKNSNSSYIPLLLLLKETDGELNFNNMNNAFSETEVNNELSVCSSFKNEFRIRELIQELKVHLSSSFSSDTDREHLIQKILSSFEKSLSILYWSELQNSAALINTASNDPESPRYMCDSPGTGSVNFDGVSIEPSKKRKLQPKWTQHVHGIHENGLEGPLDDGYRWIKYGKKDVLGVKYPRIYYKCIYRNTTNCLATKQVQRSDEDPTIFEVTYRGFHTCSLPEKQQEEQNYITSSDQL